MKMIWMHSIMSRIFDFLSTVSNPQDGMCSFRLDNLADPPEDQKDEHRHLWPQPNVGYVDAWPFGVDSLGCARQSFLNLVSQVL